jgi:hypothetical protein
MNETNNNQNRQQIRARNAIRVPEHIQRMVIARRVYRLRARPGFKIKVKSFATHGLDDINPIEPRVPNGVAQSPVPSASF